MTQTRDLYRVLKKMIPTICCQCSHFIMVERIFRVSLSAIPTDITLLVLLFDNYLLPKCFNSIVIHENKLNLY